MPVEGSRLNRLMNSAFLKFAVVGLITTGLDFVVFGFLTGSAGMRAAAANVASYSCGIIVSFTLNRVWTFGQIQHDSPLKHQMLRFGLTHVAGLILSTSLVAFLALLLPALVAKAISVPLVFIWNYMLAKFWVFK
jgi:putative flippase GtrA